MQTLLDTTNRLRDQILANTETVTSLLQRANALKTKILEQRKQSLSRDEVPPSEESLYQRVIRDREKWIEQLEQANSALKADLQDYQTTLELALQKHKAKLVEMKQEYLRRENQILHELAIERAHNVAIRKQNAELKAGLAAALEVIRQAATLNEDELKYREIVAELVKENESLRAILDAEEEAVLKAAATPSPAEFANGTAKAISVERHSNHVAETPPTSDNTA